MKKGYTYIFTIILVNLILIICLGISTKFKTYSLYKGGISKVQNHYDSVSLLNVYTTLDEFHTECKNFYEGKQINREINYYGISGRLRLYEDSSIFNDGVRIEIKTKNGNIESISSAKINVVNEVYSKKRGEKQIAILNQNTIKDENIDKVEEISKEVYNKETRYKVISLESGIYYGKRENGNFIVTTENGDIVDSADLYKPFVIDGENSTLIFKDSFKIEAIINLKEIVLNGPLELSGLLFLNSQIVSLNQDSLYIKGLVINKMGVSENNLVATYNYKSLRSIRFILPKYIKPTVYCIYHS